MTQRRFSESDINFFTRLLNRWFFLSTRDKRMFLALANHREWEMRKRRSHDYANSHHAAEQRVGQTLPTLAQYSFISEVNNTHVKVQYLPSYHVAQNTTFLSSVGSPVKKTLTIKVFVNRREVTQRYAAWNMHMLRTLCRQIGKYMSTQGVNVNVNGKFSNT